MKEIHFYTNLNNIEQVSDWDLETMYTDYVGTLEAIQDPNKKIIKTTQLGFLTDTLKSLIQDYRIYIHNRNEVFEVSKSFIDNLETSNVYKLLVSNYFGRVE